MYRTHTCGELNLKNKGEKVQLVGWIQKVRNLGRMSFIDLRDHYGITQLAFNEEWNASLMEKVRRIGREYVIQAEGEVVERSNKNLSISTGKIEIKVSSFTVLNSSKIPPFTIEDQTDGGEELRMRYRYLDIRRNPIKKNLLLRNKLNLTVRQYLNEKGFIEIETPHLIKSTPEGARDFIVPSRINEGQFYALPQSPQTFKQLLMIGGIDKYYQIVKCFRDEDMRADRQPEFTQIDCEMAFVESKDVLQTFEGLVSHLLKEIVGVEVGAFPRITYTDAIRLYGNDKPDIRFGMTFTELRSVAKNVNFKIFDEAELIVGINVEGGANYSRKQMDALTAFVKRPQVRADVLIWCRYNRDGSLKSSVDKFFDQYALLKWAEEFDAKPGDLMLIIPGKARKSRKALGELRLHLAEELGLRNPKTFAPLWVVDFPLLERDEETQRWYARHHPFTSPYPEDISLFDSDPGKVRANAYDMVLNGNEIGGGSIRIHDKGIQHKMLSILGFSDEDVKSQFGFLMDALEYGAPPHGGIAFGFDRLVTILGGGESIRNFIAFPKNNAGRDLMIDSPSYISREQLDELKLKINV